MFRSLLVLLAATTFVGAATIDPPVRPTPFVRTVSPSPAKAGGALVVTGLHLGKEFVGSLYLTQGDDTVPLEMKSQSDESIKATIPAGVKPGRFGLMILTQGEIPRYIEEPVFVQVE